MIRAALILGIALPSGAVASPLLGTWCGETGGRIYVTPEHFGANEHTICDWDTPPGDAPRKVSSLFCREMRELDGNWIEVNPRTEVISFRKLGADRLRMQLHGKDAVILDRCE